MRGQVYEIEGKKIFVFGGAYSIDKSMRTPGISWWSQEMPSEEEKDEAIRNLEKVNWNVDYIITHAAPEKTMSMFHSSHIYEMPLNGFLEYISEQTKCSAYWIWFVGKFLHPY